MTTMTSDRPGSATATLEDEVRRMRALLERTDAPASEAEPLAPRAPGLARLVDLFGLSTFEADVLMLVAATELDGAVAELVAGLTGGDPGLDPRPTFGLAFARLPDGHWDALSPERPLRQWGLVTLAAGPTLTTRRLGIDEPVLHALTGTSPGCGDLDGLIVHLDPSAPLAPSHAATADEVATTLAAAGPALARLTADTPTIALDVATHAATRLGCDAVLVRTDGLPPFGPRLADLARQLDRHLLLHRGIPILVGERSTLADHLLAPIVLTTSADDPPLRRVELRWAVHPIEVAERRQVWRDALPAEHGNDRELACAVDEVAAHHRFDTRTIVAVAAELRSRPGDGPSPEALRRSCRDRGRVAMDGLAERIEARAGWDDLVLPDGATALLRHLTEHVRRRAVVDERWGFAATTTRGLGVTALFAGESGTGKTMAAEVIARDLDLDLYRIDLSAVVDKYIGETEKNLRRVFDAAERSGAVLLFDEADALFGKRGEVRDGHDRYANLEVSYLLQRVETFQGVAILTTNLRSNVDRAFLRRLRFVVEFPFPDEALRARIWQRAFPAATPTDGLDPDRLARLRVSGGSIRGIAVAAAVAAAAEDTAVAPRHVLHAARIEYAKAERALNHAETTALTGGGA